MDARLQVLLLIAGSGAFGGFVDGMIVSRRYAVRWKEKSWDIGSLGDVLVGAAASLAIFTVATSVFNLSLAKLSDADMFVKLIAWGVLSGFAGLRLLEGMSKQLVEEIATKAAEDAVKKAVTQDIEVESNIKAGEAALTKYDMGKELGWLKDKAREKEAEALLKTAFLKFDAALEKQPDNEQAERGKARAHRRQAEREHEKGNVKEAQQSWASAIALLQKTINRNPNASLAHYNLACYMRLSHASDEEVFGSLRKAIQISPALKNNAKSDPDFDARFRKLDEFKKMTG